MEEGRRKWGKEQKNLLVLFLVYLPDNQSKNEGKKIKVKTA